MASKRQTVPQEFTPGFLQQLDARTAVAQTLQLRFNALTDDLGGVQSLSYQQRSLVERVLWLEYWIQTTETDLANGGDFDVGKWVQACNAIQGIYSKLGLNRTAKDVNLGSFLQQRQGASK